MIIPDSGLGDFISALHSAAIHAKAFNRNLKILRDENFACNFNGIEHPYLFDENTIIEPQEMKYWGEIMHHVPKFRWPGSENITIGSMSLSSGWKHVHDTNAKTMVVVSGNWHNHETRKLISADLGISIPNVLQCISKWFFRFTDKMKTQLAVSDTHIPCTSIHIRSIRYLRQSKLIRGSVHDDTAFDKTLDISKHLHSFCRFIEVAKLLNRKHNAHTKFVVFSDSTAVKNYVVNNCTRTEIELSSSLDSNHLNKHLGTHRSECFEQNISHTLMQWYYMSTCSLHVNSVSGFSMSAALLSNSPIAVVNNYRTYEMYPSIMSAPIHYLGR